MDEDFVMESMADFIETRDKAKRKRKARRHSPAQGCAQGAEEE